MLYATIPIIDNVTPRVTDLGSYASNIVALALTVAGLAAFLYLAWGGLNWVMSSGDKTKVEMARGRITNAIIGLGIVAASWAIFLILNHFFGLGMAGGTSTGTGGGGGNGGGPISYVCISTAQCDAYCPNADYRTVRGGSCGQGRVNCACVHQDNPKLDQVPAANGGNL